MPQCRMPPSYASTWRARRRVIPFIHSVIHSLWMGNGCPNPLGSAHPLVSQNLTTGPWCGNGTLVPRRGRCSHRPCDSSVFAARRVVGPVGRWVWLAPL